MGTMTTNISENKVIPKYDMPNSLSWENKVNPVFINYSFQEAQSYLLFEPLYY